MDRSGYPNWPDRSPHLQWRSQQRVSRIDADGSSWTEFQRQCPVLSQVHQYCADPTSMSLFRHRQKFAARMCRISRESRTVEQGASNKKCCQISSIPVSPRAHSQQNCATILTYFEGSFPLLSAAADEVRTSRNRATLVSNIVFRLPCQLEK